MHRADIVNFLADAIPDGVVHCGHRAVGFEQSGDIARVKFANGATAEADVVVACDGIHSELRPHVFPPSKPVFHGTISYRGLVPADRLPGWPMDRWEMWAGPSKHFLVFPVRHGTMVNYVGFVPTDEEMKESWSAPGDPDKLRAEFEGWDPRIGQVLKEVDHCFRWALYDREPLPQWTKGRLTLLGDAAHPMLPHLGQGANQSIEDGMALATILSETDTRDVPAALQAYDKLRRRRVAEIQLGARQNGLRVDSMSGYADLKKRDAELAAHADFRAHLYAYDVVPDAKAVVRAA
jgi:salicylate hydroxylase